MRSPGKIIFAVLSILSLFASLFFIYGFISTRNSFNVQYVENQILETSEFQQKNIMDFFNERRSDVETLTKFESVKNVFNEELVSRNFIAKDDVYRSSKIISKSIENYLISNPEITLKELQNSLEFQKLAVQRIAGKGYSLIYDASNGKILFHPNKEFVDNNIEFLKDTAGDFYIQSKDIIQGKDFTEGSYTLLESDGTLKQKFATHQRIPVKTGDGYEFSFASTVYNEDYKVVKYLDLEVENYLNGLNATSNYHGFYFINNEGIIIYNVGHNEYSGLNVFDLKNDLTELFIELSSNKSTAITGPHFKERQKGDIVFSVGSSVYNENDFSGVVVFQFPAEKIYEIISMEKSLGEYGESYLVNSAGQLSSPIKFAKGDILVQEILTEDVQSCSLHKHNQEERVNRSINYMGESVLSNHKYLDDLCLMTSVLYDEAIVNPQEKNKKQKNIFVIILFVIILFLLFCVKKYIDKRYIFKKRKQFNYFKLSNKFLKKITPKRAMMFGLILILGGIFVLWNFYRYLYPGIYWENFADLTIILLSFLIFSKSIKIKKLDSKNFLVMGSIILILEKIIEVLIRTVGILQSSVIDIEVFAWIYLFKYLGFVFIAKGFFGRAKK